MNLSNRFKQDIVKITPYVEEQEINQLESYWACMRSKAEYDAIYEYIDKMKTENDLP